MAETMTALPLKVKITDHSKAHIKKSNHRHLVVDLYVSNNNPVASCSVTVSGVLFKEVISSFGQLCKDVSD